MTRRNPKLRVSAFVGITMAALLGTSLRDNHSADDVSSPQGKTEVLDLRTDGLPIPLVISGDSLERRVTSLEIRAKLTNGGNSKGTITLDESPLTFNDFGDVKLTKPKPAKPCEVVLKPVKQSEKNEDRRLYEVVFSDGSFPKRIFLVLSAGTTGPHRLLVLRDDQPVHILDLQGLPEIKSPLPDAPLGVSFNLTTLSSAHGRGEGGLQLVTIAGTTDGPTHLGLDPNYLTFNAFGGVTATTLIGYQPIPATIKRIDIPDPTKKGRLLFEVVTERDRLKARYCLVLSPTEAGPHRLLIHQEGTLQYVLPLTDLNRQDHLTLQSQLVACSSQEQQAVAELRKAIGYSFRLKIESGAITEAHISSGADAARVDSSLKGLTNLKTLDFSGSRLGARGLINLRYLTHLETLRFSSAEIADAGLESLGQLPELQHLSFYCCQGISNEGLVHLQGLKHLKHLQLSREDYPKSGRPAARRITDAGLERLKGLTNLEYLNLMGQSITDAGLEHLKGLTHLNELYISGDGITDVGLEHLKGLSHLKSLHLYQTRVTHGGQEGLKSKLPALRTGG